jgi:hypothetical protein
VGQVIFKLEGEMVSDDGYDIEVRLKYNSKLLHDILQVLGKGETLLALFRNLTEIKSENPAQKVRATIDIE